MASKHRSTRLRAVGAFLAGAAALVLALAPASEAAETYEMNLGSLAPKGTPWMSMLEKIEQYLESESDGRINVIIRPPGVMAEVEMVRETRKGERLQGCGVTTAAIAEGGNLPQLQLVELPYLFRDAAEADHILDEVLFDPMSDLMARRGFVLGVWSENGWRSFATKGSPVRSPADLAKFKMRAQESDVHMAMYKAYGTQAVQKPMTEVLTALQSDVVDGLDNTALYILSAGLAEPLEYFTVSRHIYQPAAIIYSKRWFDDLPEDLQQLVRDTRRFTEEGRAAIRTEEAAMMETFPMFGVEVIELSAEEREAFAAPVRELHSRFATEIDGGTELLQKIESALQARR